MSEHVITAAPRSSTVLNFLAAIWRTARPKQWIKNAFVLAPLLFSGQINNYRSVGSALLAASAFTLAAVATYFANDLVDRERDRKHPVKRLRPIAAGRISVVLATGIATCAALLGLALAAWVNVETCATLAVYMALQVAYTFWLKHRALMDVLCIALRFVLRVIVGAAALKVVPSPWLLVCTFFLATFLGFAKRLGEAVRLGDSLPHGPSSRPVLIAYHDRLLLNLLSITCSLTTLSYSLYAVERQPPSLLLLSTIPIVTYALLRYLLLVLRLDGKPDGENPEDLIIRDRGLIVSGLVWAAMSAIAVITSPALPLN